ncbi:sensor histidine kinase [Aquipuribacter hungaricus]|uniref:Sensor histidine kinase n=1 Tax=Aquipuribacter hungaricus TaxID=545624 RepID=A0ABV7WI96_9MICO
MTSPPVAGLLVLVLATLTALLVVAVGWALGRWGTGRRLTSDADRARFETLHLTALAAPSLRQGLSQEGARPAARHLRALLGTPALALVSATELLAWEGADDGGGSGGSHASHAVDHAARAVRESRTRVLGPREVACERPGCTLRGAVVSVLGVQDRVIGAVVAYSRERPTAQLVRATEEVARWVASQVELAELDQQRSRTAEAELRALRAQISPHFVYNCLAAIAVFVRTDPDRARELLLDFADFTRYAFRREAAFTTLADELRNVERYLVLEQARFGDRLVVDLTVAQEVLAVTVPFLSVQPLVENAVRHGLESGRATVRVVVRADDDGDGATISVDDDGAGADPAVVLAAVEGRGSPDSIGLGNVDLRLRQVFGDAAGLVVDTAPGAGTRVSFRVPKFAVGVRPG